MNIAAFLPTSITIITNNVPYKKERQAIEDSSKIKQGSLLGVFRFGFERQL